MFYLAFKLGIILNEYNETIIEFGFRVIWKIMEILDDVICRGLVGPMSFILCPSFFRW